MLLAGTGRAAETTVTHALSLFGKPEYPPDFTHFKFVNPDAPKGGEVKLEAFGTFDSFNPFIVKGSPAGGLNLIYDSLMEDSPDEASTNYGLLAESVEVPDDRSWVAYTLRPEARWHDGKPVTTADVIFSFNMLKEKAPLYRYYYANIDKAEATGPRTVKFTFSGPANRELPHIVGQLFVLPEHYWRDREFDATTLEPPLGSGPYRIKDFNAGRWIAYERVPDYWAKDLPLMRGRYNFDTLRFEYFRDRDISFEAFKAHAFDFRVESSSKLWATSYEFPAIKDGRVIKELIDDDSPDPMQAFILNLRRPKFEDRKVREALGLAFDFEWTNKNLFYGQYTRTKSYFSSSELASSGLPGPDELALLEPLRDKIPEEVFTTAYEPPSTDGSGNNRANLRKAIALLREAGWEVKDGVLTRTSDGLKMEIEVLLVQPDFERVVAPWIENLKRLGVQATIRIVDSAQYRQRIDTFDFDVISSGWQQSLSPGNEQRDYWGSVAADRQGSRNYAGIKDAAVDSLIDHIIFAKDRAALLTACHALDRVLLWHHYVIPHWYFRFYRAAYWNRFSRPAIKPKYAIGFTDTWWIDPAKESALAAREAQKN